MGESRRRILARQKASQKVVLDHLESITRIDYSAVERRLLAEGHNPDYISKKGSIHGKFNYLGVETGRFPVVVLPSVEDKPYTRETPAADWREKGEPDPHGTYYDDKKRHEIMGGQFTDDEIAYQCGMASGRDLDSVAVLYRAKERIRWLSRQLVAAEKRIKELEGK